MINECYNAPMLAKVAVISTVLGQNEMNGCDEFEIGYGEEISCHKSCITTLRVPKLLSTYNFVGLAGSL